MRLFSEVAPNIERGECGKIIHPITNVKLADYAKSTVGLSDATTRLQDCRADQADESSHK